MAELLILARDSWMDSLSAQEIAKRSENPNWAAKYAARQRKGDVVEIRDDGFFLGTGRGYDKEAFIVVKVKNRTASQLKELQGTLISGSNLVAKFRANVGTLPADKSEITLASITVKS